MSVSFAIEDWTYLLYGAPAQYVHLPNVNIPPKPQEQNAYEFKLAECSQACPEGCGCFSS